MTHRKKPPRLDKPATKKNFNDAANDDGGSTPPPKDPPKRRLTLIRRPDQVTDANTGRTLLIDAILKKDPARVETLLKSGASVSKSMKDGRSPLHIAAATGQIWAIQLLAKYGVQPNARDKKLRTACFEALSAPDPAATIRALHDIGCNMSIPDNESRLPLHIAADSSDRDAVAAVLELTENPNVPDKNGWYPFHFACKNNSADVVKLLVEKSVMTEVANNKGDTGLHLAVTRPDPAITQYLLTTDAVVLVNAVNLEGRTALHMAAAEQQTNNVVQLIKAGAHINAHDNEGYTALHEAARKNDLFLAKLLVRHGADVGKAGKQMTSTPLHLAIRSSNTSNAMIDFLIEHNADLNARDKNGFTPLMAAALTGRDALCTKMLEAGADPSILDSNGRNVLFFISPALRLDTVKAMINAGADMNVHDYISDRTPLMAALQEHKTGLARLLIEQGCNLDATNDIGATALLFAMRYDHEPIALLLLKKGADPKIIEQETKVSPLHLAATLGFTDCVAQILSKGADIEARDYLGRTPLAYALMNGLTSMDLLKLLVKHGADPVNPDNKGTTPYDYAYGDNRSLVMALFDQELNKKKTTYSPKRPPWRPW